MVEVFDACLALLQLVLVDQRGHLASDTAELGEVAELGGLARARVSLLARTRLGFIGLRAACGQAELACESEADYVHTAVALAQDLPRLRALQQHLDAQRLHLPLFDTNRYVRHYEALLSRMFERQQAGLAPGALKAELLVRA